jgi:hypothetical protein
LYIACLYECNLPHRLTGLGTKPRQQGISTACLPNIFHLYKRLSLINECIVPAVLSVDNSVVDLETIEALYENVSIPRCAVKSFNELGHFPILLSIQNVTSTLGVRENV